MSEEIPTIKLQELDEKARRASAYLLMNGGMGDSYPDVTLSHLGFDELPETGTVLNIGTGDQLMLERYAHEHNPDLQIVSFDFQLSDQYNREDYLDAQKQEGLNNIFVAGLAQELPFAPETFDLIISHAAVPVYLGPDYLPEAEKHLKAFYAGVWNVLKPGAEFRATPILDFDIDINKQALKEVGIPEASYIFEEFTTAGPRSGNPEKWIRLILTKPNPSNS